ncbi:hypothetical protein DY000_02033131 [Brassica cretica]|uniref:Transmembrane protein n=1 Tax=Brassica cretica TaxID=69181 RepID=A0ABQ7DMB4_BRACR|nr:hypothetical protein DY000_02033131 [Brassica cretica]
MDGCSGVRPPCERACQLVKRRPSPLSLVSFASQVLLLPLVLVAALSFDCFPVKVFARELAGIDLDSAGDGFKAQRRISFLSVKSDFRVLRGRFYFFSIGKKAATETKVKLGVFRGCRSLDLLLLVLLSGCRFLFFWFSQGVEPIGQVCAGPSSGGEWRFAVLCCVGVVYGCGVVMPSVSDSVGLFFLELVLVNIGEACRYVFFGVARFLFVLVGPLSMGSTLWTWIRLLLIGDTIRSINASQCHV